MGVWSYLFAGDDVSLGKFSPLFTALLEGGLLFFQVFLKLIDKVVIICAVQQTGPSCIYTYPFSPQNEGVSHGFIKGDKQILNGYCQ